MRRISNYGFGTCKNQMIKWWSNRMKMIIKSSSKSEKKSVADSLTRGIAAKVRQKEEWIKWRFIGHKLKLNKIMQSTCVSEHGMSCDVMWCNSMSCDLMLQFKHNHNYTNTPNCFFSPVPFACGMTDIIYIIYVIPILYF